jgi:hypothetical protein
LARSNTADFLVLGDVVTTADEGILVDAWNNSRPVDDANTAAFVVERPFVVGAISCADDGADAEGAPSSVDDSAAVVVFVEASGGGVVALPGKGADDAAIPSAADEAVAAAAAADAVF